jgi:hypothetical protein
MLSAMNSKLLLPACLLVCVLSPRAEEPAAAPAIDFKDVAAGEVPEAFMSTDQEAKFSIVADGENKVLELAGQPIVDGGMLVGKSVKGAGTVTARIKTAGKRRTQPRFGVGLHGVSGPRLRVVPATKQVEIVLTSDKEEAIGTAAYGWTSGTWTWLEFTIKAKAGGGSEMEGRVWAEGEKRPEKPTVTATSEEAPSQGKASVWGTPYAELPVWFDDITVRAGE